MKAQGQRPPVQGSTRLGFLRDGAARLAAVVLGLVGGLAAFGAKRRQTVWQIDPFKCVQCERCATECVLSPSAVKCVQSYPICGYCQLCFGYFQPNAPELTAAAENQLCPTDAIERKFVEEPYWEYNIHETLCIGCAKCVKACEVFGNGSFYLQVRHDRCLNCNNCSIAMKCPSNAWERVPADAPYRLKHLPAGNSAAVPGIGHHQAGVSQGGFPFLEARRGFAHPSSASSIRQAMLAWFFCLLCFSAGAVIAAEATAAEEAMRFPAPEFKGGYTFPATTVPAPRAELREWVDVAVLAGALGLAAWLAVRQHSRRGLFALTLFSLAYFGFYKEGCVCPIGSIQNVALSIFQPNYAVPASVLAVFLLPLFFALFYGRVFCSSVCALGAIQDLVALKPLPVPRRLALGLSVVPYVYLGLAVLLASVGAGFLICRFDPFIGFFRLSGNAPYLWLGTIFLVVGIFVARPYCRFFCPYGALLGMLSRVSKWHLAITPSNCVNCRLCESSCPYDYIHKPTVGLPQESRRLGVRRLGSLVALLPVLVGLCAWVGHRVAAPIARYHPTIALAEEVLAEKRQANVNQTLETQTFRSKGVSESALVEQARQLRVTFERGGWALGGFAGLLIGLKLIGVSLARPRTDYEVDKANCFSCARCCTYCPNDPSAAKAARAGMPDAATAECPRPASAVARTSPLTIKEPCEVPNLS